jgi:hypothetical protein
MTVTQELLNDLNYLNTGEIKSFCRQHSIPYTIVIETEDGKRKTRDDDRKGVMLDRVRHFLQTGVVLPETLFPAAVVRFDPLAENLTADDRLFYGQYDKANRAMIALLKGLTGGQFKDGAIARILARKFWSSGKTPTFREYATEWLHETKGHTKPSPEAAYLSDRAAKGAVPEWKKLRASKASKVIKLLNEITAPFSHGSETFRSDSEPRP